MSSVYGANVTKVRAGGSGDNYVHDGFIKTVEKVWIDSYAYTSPDWARSSNSLVIARVPRGKKITDIVVHCPTFGGAGTATTIYCSYAALAPTSLTPSLGTLRIDTQGKTAAIATTMATFRLDTAYIGTVVPTTSTGVTDELDIHITLGTTGDADISGSTGTLKTIVKWT